MFLEHRLAVELQGLGLIEKMFPIFIGNLDATTSEYSDYFKSSCHPSLSEVTVKSVEEKLRQHMESQALGTPLVPDRTVKSVVDAITACQGAFIVGPADATFAAAAASIATMLTDGSVVSVPQEATKDIKTLMTENGVLKSEMNTLKSENGALKGEVGALKSEVGALKGLRATTLASLRSSEFTSVEAVISHMEALLQR